MNSKERVAAMISREPVDSIPLGFYVVDCDTVEKVIGRKTYVRDKIGRQIAFWEGRRDEVVQSYITDTIEFFEKLDCVDLITFKEAAIVPPKDYQPNPRRKIAEDLWEDDAGRIYKASYVSNEMVCVEDPNARDVSDFSEDMFPEVSEDELQPPDESIFEAADAVTEVLGKDRYIAGKCGGMTAFTLVGGQETGLMIYALKPGVVKAANRRSVKIQNYRDEYFIRSSQDGVLLEQDMGGTNGPFISPEKFRECCFPYLKERVSNIKQFDKQVILHNCGDNRPLIDMFIKAGIQCYQSLQTNAGMELGHLQERFGNRIIFWGGVATELLVGGTPAEVRENVREAMEIGASADGFILGPSHSVAYGTKYENFMAMLDEYDKNKDKF
ncbi:MAG: uroporphyrinogen decarboxylase family protein [Candidatus Brocadiia bacterium]